MAVQSLVNDEEQRLSIRKMQEKFSITSVKGEDSVHPPPAGARQSIFCANEATLFCVQNAYSFPSLLNMAPKVLLVSLLNGKLQQQERRCVLYMSHLIMSFFHPAFRDLTLMGVEAFDFSYSNVLVSRDFKSIRLIDIDGNSQGSIKYPSLEGNVVANGEMTPPSPTCRLQKPCLNVDLNVLLPSVIEQLLLGKGRGRSFVSNKRSEIWRASEENGKSMIREILMDNFYPGMEEHHLAVPLSGPASPSLDRVAKSKAQIHVTKVSEWFYAVMKKKPPWASWTNDIYDCMRCIDHLPIS